MKKLKLKSWVVPSIYAISLSVIFVSVFVIGKTVVNEYAPSKDEDIYIPDSLITNDYTSVVEITNETVNHPFLLEGVSIAKNYYDKDGEKEAQIDSLIYYKNTYMENTGVLYQNDTSFDVVSVLDGTVTSITQDELLGSVVEITHSTELITIYHCLKDVSVNVGDNVKQNDVIGKSGKVNVDKGYENALLFEVNYQGKVINPIEFYNMRVSDLMG